MDWMRVCVDSHGSAVAFYRTSALAPPGFNIHFKGAPGMHAALGCLFDVAAQCKVIASGGAAEPGTLFYATFTPDRCRAVLALVVALRDLRAALEPRDDDAAADFCYFTGCMLGASGELLRYGKAKVEALRALCEDATATPEVKRLAEDFFENLCAFEEKFAIWRPRAV